MRIPSSAICLVVVISSWRPLSAAQLAGTIQYEKVRVTAAGLQINAPIQVPCAFVRIEVVDSASKNVLAATTTLRDGSYAVKVPLASATRIYARALAMAENAIVTTPDDIAPATYSVISDTIELAPNGTATLSILARDRHVGPGPDRSRGSGPFNIIAQIVKANSLLRSARPNIVIPSVSIRWSPTYVGGTFFRSTDNEAFINGRRGEDSDEFDDAVINHEYGHFLASAFSRNDSPNGQHVYWAQIDPRLAWSQGWGNYFGCAVSGGPLYLDSGGTNNGIILEENIEDNRLVAQRGYWNEHTVGAVLWDSHDSTVDDGETLRTPFADTWAVFTALTSHRYVYLISYADQYVLLFPARRDALTTLLAAHDIVFDSAAMPSVGEPFPMKLPTDQAIIGIADSISDQHPNRWLSSRFYRFVVPAGTGTSTHRSITAKLNIDASNDTATPKRADLDLYLFDINERPISQSKKTNGVGGTESITVNVKPGDYVLEVRSWWFKNDTFYPNQASYTVSVEVK